jgi:hypothetical protein
MVCWVSTVGSRLTPELSVDPVLSAVLAAKDRVPEPSLSDV